MISAIVLGAGLSTRMGALKQLLPFGDRTVIEQVVSTLLDCTIDEIVVVLGHRHAEIAEVLSKWDVRVTFNPRYAEGMLTSLQHGWRNVHQDADAVMHVLGDQPHLDARVAQKLIAAYRASDAGIAVPMFNGRRGHPILLNARYRDEILSLGDGETMRDVLRGHAAEVREVFVESDGILRDMDTWQEYERELSYRQHTFV
ncbi:molybdenum cofactor cytidylyltransferase [Anaerolineae bacterium]|nr:molybdenum cofactor cytidylyltransferase [Anaerolineae bacterium]